VKYYYFSLLKIQYSKNFIAQSPSSLKSGCLVEKFKASLSSNQTQSSSSQISRRKRTRNKAAPAALSKTFEELLTHNHVSALKNLN